MFVILWLLVRFTQTSNESFEWFMPMSPEGNPLFLVGPMISGFIIHPMLMPIIRNNGGYINAKRNIIIGYVLVTFT